MQSVETLSNFPLLDGNNEMDGERTTAWYTMLTPVLGEGTFKCCGFQT